jgi:hypothetical protein
MGEGQIRVLGADLEKEIANLKSDNIRMEEILS